MDITDRPTYTCTIDNIAHICSIVNSGSTRRVQMQKQTTPFLLNCVKSFFSCGFMVNPRYDKLWYSE